MSLEEGTNTSTPWDQAMTLSAFQPGEAVALSDPKQGAAILQLQAQSRGAQGPQPAHPSTMVLF